MRTSRLVLVVVASMLVAAGARAAQQSKKEPAAKQPASKILTLSGCVVDQPSDKQLVLADGNGGPMYRLTGTDLHEYVGKRVEVSGRAPGRVQVVTGLFPTPNIAAQAGAIDPAQAATAAASTTPGNGKQLPEFRVRAVQPITGTCPQK